MCVVDHWAFEVALSCWNWVQAHTWNWMFKPALAREERAFSGSQQTGNKPSGMKKRKKSSVCSVCHSYSILMSVNWHVVCSLWGNKLNVGVRKAEVQSNSNLPTTTPFIFKWHSSLRATDVLISAVEGTTVGFFVLYVKPLVPFLHFCDCGKHFWFISYFKLAAKCSWLFIKSHSCWLHQ